VQLTMSHDKKISIYEHYVRKMAVTIRTYTFFEPHAEISHGAFFNTSVVTATISSWVLVFNSAIVVGRVYFAFKAASWEKIALKVRWSWGGEGGNERCRTIRWHEDFERLPLTLLRCGSVLLKPRIIKIAWRAVDLFCNKSVEHINVSRWRGCRCRTLWALSDRRLNRSIVLQGSLTWLSWWWFFF